MFVFLDGEVHNMKVLLYSREEGGEKKLHIFVLCKHIVNIVYLNSCNGNK